MNTVIIDILDATVGVIENNKRFSITDSKKQNVKDLQEKQISKKSFGTWTRYQVKRKSSTLSLKTWIGASDSK